MTPNGEQDPAARGGNIPQQSLLDRWMYGPLDPDVANLAAPTPSEAAAKMSAGELQAINQQLQIEAQRKRQVVRTRRILVGVGLVGIGVSVLIADNNTVIRALLVIGLFAFVGAALISPREVVQRIRELRLARDVLEKKGQEAYKLFISHQAELRGYYDLARKHSRIMLVAGLVCIAAGLLIIGGAGWVIIDPPPSFGQAGRPDEIVIGVLGAVGGILTNYVAAVYLRMYAAASQALNEFHSRLVMTHHLHFANYLASKVEDEGPQDTTFSKMAIALASR